MGYKNVLIEIENTRKELNITQRKLARIVGMSPQHYCATMKGRNALMAPKLIELIEALGYNITFSKIIR